MKICGVDPGLNGALALLESADGPVRVVDCADMPRGLRGPTSQKEQVDILSLADILRRWKPDVVALELVHAVQDSGAAGAFNFGHSFCAVEATTLTLGISLRMITPQSWKKTMGLHKTDKRASLAMAQRMFPDAPLRLAKHEARAEAILIAMHLITKEGRLLDVGISGEGNSGKSDARQEDPRRRPAQGGEA